MNTVKCAVQVPLRNEGERCLDEKGAIGSGPALWLETPLSII